MPTDKMMQESIVKISDTMQTQEQCKESGGHDFIVNRYDGEYVYSFCNKCGVFSKDKANKVNTTAIKSFTASIQGHISEPRTID